MSDMTTTPLSQEQWQALGRLADLTTSLTGTAEVRELRDTITALSASGFLGALRENADRLTQLIQVGATRLDEAREANAGLSAADRQRDAERLHSLLEKADLLGEYLSANLAGPAVGWSVDLFDFARREAVLESIQEGLVTLGHLHRNGTLKWLRDSSDYLDILEQKRLLSSLAEDGIEGLGDIPEQARKVLIGAREALKDADADADHLGGIKGLFHLLRDPEVQQGIRALAVLPAHLTDTKAA